MRRLISTSAIVVAIVVVVVVGALAAYMVMTFQGQTSHTTTTPAAPCSEVSLVQPSAVANYLGGAWTLNGGRSSVACINWSSRTVVVRYLNGTIVGLSLNQLLKAINITGTAAGNASWKYNLASVYGLLPAAVELNLSAVDVAIYEGAVGAGRYNLSVAVLVFRNESAANLTAAMIMAAYAPSEALSPSSVRQPIQAGQVYIYNLSYVFNWTYGVTPTDVEFMFSANTTIEELYIIWLKPSGSNITLAATVGSTSATYDLEQFSVALASYLLEKTGKIFNATTQDLSMALFDRLSQSAIGPVERGTYHVIVYLVTLGPARFSTAQIRVLGNAYSVTSGRVNLTGVGGVLTELVTSQQGVALIAVRGRYVVLMLSDLTSVSASAWEGLLTQVLNNLPSS